MLSHEKAPLRGKTLSIVALVALLLMLWRWLIPAPGDVLVTHQGSSAAPMAESAMAKSLDGPAEQAVDCRAASGMQARLRDLMGRSMSLFELAQDNIMGEIERWPEQIAGSDDPQMRYVASFGPLGQRSGAIAPQERIRQVGEALAVDGTNPMYLSTLMQLCIEHGTSSACDLPALERQLVDFDGDNGLSWRLISMSCTARGDTRCAVEAMELAAQAPAYREYYVERVLLAEQVMQSVGFSFPFSSTSAYAIASMDFPSAVHSHDPCRGPASPRLDRACLRHGERLEAEGTTSWMQLLGRTMQMRAAKRLGDERARAAAALRIEQANDVLGMVSDEDGQLTITYTVFTARLTWDREFFQRYMAHMLRVGEAQALVDGATGWGIGPAQCLERIDWDEYHDD